jgi:ABC-type lipoprotein release transport system permease subunit
MAKFLEIAGTGVAAILLHPLRSLVTVAALVVVLIPYLAGIGLSKGVEREAEASIRFGPDLYVSGQQFGRTVPIPLTAVAQIRKIDGVIEVTPRIVGRVVLGKENEEAVIVGMPREKFPAVIACVEGALSEGTTMNKVVATNELVVGTELARRLNLRVGSLIPPFYHNDRGDRVSKVVGIFKSDVSLWQANLVFTSFETAAAIFNQEGLATDLLVDCRPGYEHAVRTAILKTLSFPSLEGKGMIGPNVVAREDLQAILPGGLLHREGIFNLHFLLAFTVGILAVLVTSGFGLSERRREIGILKATGWQTDEVLLRSVVESFLLALAGASLSLLAAFVWLKLLNGYWIAGIFLAGVAKAPGFAVPFRLTPLPTLLAFLLALVVIMTGTVYSSWRAATAPPREAMR